MGDLSRDSRRSSHCGTSGENDKGRVYEGIPVPAIRCAHGVNGLHADMTRKQHQDQDTLHSTNKRSKE